MAEIRIPFDQIPADIQRRLRDISNKVINPCSPLDHLSSSTSLSSLSSSSSTTTSSLSSSSSVLPPLYSSSQNDLHRSLSSTSLNLNGSAASAMMTSHSSSTNRNSLRTNSNRMTNTNSNSTRIREMEDEERFVVRNNDVNYDVTNDDDDVDEVDGGDMDSSIVHVVDDAALRHQNSSHVMSMEVMDESDIVRIFTGEHQTSASARPSSSSSKPRGGDNNNTRLSGDSGIVRIFTSDDEDDNDNDDDNHHHVEDVVDSNSNNDVVDHMSSAQEMTSSSRTTSTSAAFKLSPTKYPNFVHETKSNSLDLAAFPLRSYPYPVSPRNISDDVTTENRLLGHVDRREEQQQQQQGKEAFRKCIPGSRLSQSKDIRRKGLPGKSANIDLFSPTADLISTQYTQQKQQLHNQLFTSYGFPDGSRGDAQKTFPLVNNTKNNNNKNDDMQMKSGLQRLLPTNALPSKLYVNAIETTPTKALPSKLYVNAIETTPTKALPSKFGKIRRSPVLLPTPPQTPDDLDDGDDDNDEVFSYENVGRLCTNPNSNVSNFNNPAHFRRNSDSRVTDNSSSSFKGVRRSLIRASPIAFSPTHKMARMKVGDRQHTRKRLSFEDIDASAVASFPDAEHTEPHYWNDITQMPNRQPDFHQKLNHPLLHKISTDPTKGTNISAFNNSPPHLSHSHSYPQVTHTPSKSTSPAPFSSTSPAPFSSFDPNMDMDIDRHVLFRPASSSVQVCCSGSSSTRQASPRPSSHRSLAPPTSACQSSMSRSNTDTTPYHQASNHLHLDMDTASSSPPRESNILDSSCRSRQSPSHLTPLEVKQPRMRMYSEGFSEDFLEEMTDITSTRPSSGNKDAFIRQQRVQIVSSYGKRRRYEYSEDYDEEKCQAEGTTMSQLPSQTSPSASASTPKKTSPSLLLPTCNIPTSPTNRHQTMTSPQPEAAAMMMLPQTSPPNSQPNDTTFFNNNNNNNSNNLLLPPPPEGITSPSPWSNCSCSNFTRNVLSRASKAYVCLNSRDGDPAELRQNMSRINDEIHELLSIIHKVSTICEHHNNSGQFSGHFSPQTDSAESSTVAAVLEEGQGQGCSTETTSSTSQGLAQ